MKNIGFEELKKRADNVFCYDDDCLFVSESLQCLCSAEPVRFDFSLMVFCIDGCVEWEQHNQSCVLRQQDFAVVLPGSLLAKMAVLEGSHVKVVGVSARFLQRVLRISANLWQLVRFVKFNPVKHLGSSDFEHLLHFINLISAELNADNTCYREEIMQHLFAAFILGMVSDISHCVESSVVSDADKASFPVYIFRRFMEEVSSDNGCHRSVIYYAGLLCCSPSYLSRTVKKVSGRRALNIINEYVVDRIAYELKYSDKSIKEIAMEFDFPNVSFFAKYVRKHLKTSPTDFRNKNAAGE